jgi:hypothetical protein
MSVDLRHMQETEDRMKASLFSALNSTWFLVFVLLMLVVLGVVLPRN